MLFGCLGVPISLFGLRIPSSIIGSWVGSLVWPGPGLSWDGEIHFGSSLEVSMVDAIVGPKHVYACAPATTPSVFVGLCLICLLK